MEHPMQPIEPDTDGVDRFRANAIVRAFLDEATKAGILDLNKIACMDFSDEDRRQFAQLIGYSVGGYGELSYVSDPDYAAAFAKSCGKDERDARIEHLESLLETLRQGLKEPIAALYEKHPDDLTEKW